MSYARSLPDLTVPRSATKRPPSPQPLSTRADMAISFLDLPCEIRNMIYELDLMHDFPIKQKYFCSHPRRLRNGLLRASKTVPHEASPIFYGRDRFHCVMDACNDSFPFLRQIRPDTAR
nr:hypothetical protein CFP56_13345 [Quercus suber]